MNDYWNDPPEPPDPPACPDCNSPGDFLEATADDLVFICTECKNKFLVPRDKDPEPPAETPVPDDLPPGPCPHGNTGPCDACDRLSDFLYDSNREKS